VKYVTPRHGSPEQKIRLLVDGECASGEEAMEQILTGAICLLTGVVLIALTHRPAQALARVMDLRRHDVAVWLRF
jgi:hypothetical protein